MLGLVRRFNEKFLSSAVAFIADIVYIVAHCVTLRKLDYRAI